MEIHENHFEINENEAKPRVALAGIAKPSNKNAESCVVFKYVHCRGRFAKTSKRNFWKPDADSP